MKFLSCLHAGKVLFQLVQASKQRQTLISLISRYPYLLLSTFRNRYHCDCGELGRGISASQEQTKL